MKLYKYILYRTYTLYRDRWNSDIPETYAVCFVSLIQYFNIITIWYFIELFVDNLPEINKYIHAGIIALLIIINYVFQSKIIRYIEDAQYLDKNNYFATGWFVLLFSIFSILAALVVMSF